MEKLKSLIDHKIEITQWSDLEDIFTELLNRPINNKEEFINWLSDYDLAGSYISEDMAWRYIRMTCDTNNQELEQKYLWFVQEISPKLSPIQNQINLKISGSPFKNELKDQAYTIWFRNIDNEIELFREENIPLEVEVQTLAQKYASINGAMSIHHEGKEYTLQQAANFLKNPNRSVREIIWKKIQERRFEAHEELDNLLSELIKIRHQIALNAGFSNFRDYMHKALGRFDYSVDDCFAFHSVIRDEVVPLLKPINEKRQKSLNISPLRPWDLEVDIEGRPALLPFTNGNDLIEKTLKSFERLDPFFKTVIDTMDKKGHLDLESRIGKAPGGYNYPLALSGYPFIFMNAASSLRDVETMVHEGGHAIHSVLSQKLPLNAFRNCPSEVAELASMSMELLTIYSLDEFIPNKEDLKRAITEQIEGIIKTLPWIATIDKFQHWLYTHINHSLEERKNAWNQISQEFSLNTTDWSGLEHFRDFSWQKQLHIYEVPFYYIEYGFAQLGAIGVWKNAVESLPKAIEKYKNALSLGNTKSISEIYETAGVKFGGEKEYVKSLFQFVEKEYQKL